uniref:Interferon regulatory factor 8 n=1 Tax=Latimeria chalumnae TaxID=7897 RepID=H3AAD6_LATCH
MCDKNGGRRLKQWLIEQINSDMYPGLVWENEDKTMFRIPWKHAGKQDYVQEVDASIFKAWAVFKGKFKEGDKAEPATWKTRLRCALNKSPDFEEVTERSQLDISDPYKVYRIVPEEEQKSKNGFHMNGSSCSDIPDMKCCETELEELIKEASVDDYLGVIKSSPSPPQDNCQNPHHEDWWQHQAISVLDLNVGVAVYERERNSFSRMMISFYYGGKLAGRTLTSHSDGCRIFPSQPTFCTESIYSFDSLERVKFPSADFIQVDRQRQITNKLFGHLERGVLLHSNRQGIFIKRLCQGRVFWSGNCSPYKNSSNKLERDAVVKIFDTNQFLEEWQMCNNHQSLFPESAVTLCFGEEFPDATPLRLKLILVQIEQLSVKQIVEGPLKVYTNENLEISELTHHDPMTTRFSNELCTYNHSPKPFYRGSQQITA